MRLGAHLPIIDLDGHPFTSSAMGSYVEAAKDGGFAAIGANDHLYFSRPWLDGIVALSSVLERTDPLTVATTIALPVIRGPVPLARTAVALQTLSGGRFMLGVGPGSSPKDYAAVGQPFEERWRLFDESVRRIRSELDDERSDVPIWIGSWGSAAGLRRVARLGDGWLASAYNTSPAQVAAGRERIDGLPVTVSSFWTFVTDSAAEAEQTVDALAAMLGRDPADVAGRVLVGAAETCAERLAAYAAAGADTAFIWPVRDPVGQLTRFAAEVVPQLPPTA